MKGCLQIKNGFYYIVLSYTENGQRKRPWIATGLSAKGNKRKAEQMLAQAIHEHELKQNIRCYDVLFSEYIKHWLSICQRKVDAVTFQGYELLAQNQIIPYFAELNIKLQEVTTPILQKYIDTKAASGRIDGKGGLSARSLQLHKNIINQTLNEAVRNNLLPANPCQFLILPKVERHTANFYTEKQLNAMFKKLENDELYPLLRITALYGLRRSEVLGLQWDSLDFEHKTITIQHTVSKVTEVVHKDKTKNASSFRTFPLTTEAEHIFKELQKLEKENKYLFGSAYQQNDYIFKWSDGHTYHPDYITKKFASLLKKHNLPHIRFHELRHSCASLLINNGFNLKDVQEWLGHSDIKMTANIYGHLDITRKMNMANQLSSIIKS